MGRATLVRCATHPARLARLGRPHAEEHRAAVAAEPARGRRDAEAPAADDLGRLVVHLLPAAADGARRARGEHLDLGPPSAHLDRQFGRAAAGEADRRSASAANRPSTRASARSTEGISGSSRVTLSKGHRAADSRARTAVERADAAPRALAERRSGVLPVELRVDALEVLAAEAAAKSAARPSGRIGEGLGAQTPANVVEARG